MVTQEYRGWGYSAPDTYFIIGESEEQIDNELKEFIKEHGTDENEIWVYKNPVRPSKVNLRPEYSYEVNVKNKDTFLLMLFQRRVW